VGWPLEKRMGLEPAAVTEHSAAHPVEP
jgi:hypothetical protein